MDPEELKKLLAQLQTKQDENTKRLQDFATSVQDQLAKFGGVSTETKAAIDKLLLENGELKTRTADIEQKLARRPGAAAEQQLSVGQTVIGNDKIKAMMTERSGRVKVDVPSFRMAITSLAASAGVLVEPQRVAGVVAPPQRRLLVRDLLLPGSTGSNSIEFVQETGFTNNAAVVSETVQKPESTISFELETANVRTIAHWVHASKQILDDAAQLQSYIDGRLIYGVQLEEEAQLLLGDGTGQNLDGLVTQATAFSAAFTPDDATIIDTLRLALLQAELAEYPSTFIVLHPTDWARIELMKTSDGAYLFANPQGAVTPRLWNRDVVATQSMTVEEFLVGTQMGAQIFDKQAATVEVSTEDRDNFVKNMVTIRGEERLALAVYRPEAFITGELAVVS